MNIGIDIDDTIANTYEILFNYAQKYTCDELEKKIQKPKKLIKNHYTTTFHNWNEKEEKEFFNKYYKKILEEVKPKMYAAETISKLKEEGHKIFIVTARYKIQDFDIRKITKKWLEDNNIKYDELITNVKEKGIIAKNKKINIFIDDNYKQCTKLASENITTYMMDSRTNGVFEEKFYTRVYSWPHLYQQIKTLKEVN